MPERSQHGGQDHWLTALTTQNGVDSVLVSVVHTQGSVPRESGTKMLILPDYCVGTIGGGHLEYKAIEQAREILACDPNKQKPLRQMHRYALGPSLGQCCGGAVALLFEKITATTAEWTNELLQLRNDKLPAIIASTLPQEDVALQDDGNGKMIITESTQQGTLGSDSRDRQAVIYARDMLDCQALSPHASPGPTQHPTNTPPHRPPIYTATAHIANNLFFEPFNQTDLHLALFGAGHIAQALVRLLQDTPCMITWIDNREEVFPDNLPHNVTAVYTDTPEDEIAAITTNSFVLIMTHCHQLDLSICQRALQRSDIDFCGLIGSASKYSRFKKRLSIRGLSDQTLKRLTCPIGIDNITGKHPQQIAISVSAQVLQLAERRQAQTSAHTYQVN